MESVIPSGSRGIPWTLPPRFHNGIPRFGPDDLRHDRFNDFEKTAQRGQRDNCQPNSPLSPGMPGTHQHFAHRIKQEKSETKMNDAIIMIPSQVQPMLQPKTSRHLRIGVMRANGVKSEENEN